MEMRVHRQYPERAARLTLLCALGVAVAFGALAPAVSIDDSESYLAPARSWASGSGLRDLGERLPFYPLLLGLAIRLFGTAPEVFSLLNVALHIGAVLLVRGVLPEGWLRDVISAAALVYPPLLTTAGLILQESLLAFLISAVFVLCWRVIEKPSIPRAAVLGVVIGVAALAKTTIVPVAVAMGLLLFWQRGRHAARPAFVLAAACLLVLLPWGLRNQRVLGRFTVTNGNGGLNLFGGTVSNNILPSWYTFPEHLEARRRWEGLDPTDRPTFDNYLYAAAIERIKADPAHWLSLVSGRAFRFMLPARHWFVAVGLSRPATFGPWYVLAIGCQAVLFAGAALLALRAFSRRHVDPALAASVVVFTHQAVYAISYASPRYGATVGPVLFGALALVLSANPLDGPSRRQVGPPVAKDSAPA